MVKSEFDSPMYAVHEVFKFLEFIVGACEDKENVIDEPFPK